MGGKVKIPGMLYILLSFAPWIVYWVMCGFGSAWGIVIAFMASLLLVAPQAVTRSFNLMDLTSALYFTTALIGTFALGVEVFVKYSGFLGYLVLFLMASISLLIRQPYTLQCSKRDYPEVYWRDRGFILVNNVITAVWAAIFLVNAALFLLLAKPYPVIVTNILIAFGIAFSVVFPLEAPAYFTVREFKKYDWRVEAKPGKPREPGEYDVIIVGSGIGGLTCGALLSKWGYKVLVLEHHYQVGGYCSSFERRGFIFNAGVEDVSGLWERGPITYLLRELGLKKDDLFVRNTVRYIFRGKVIEARSLEEFTERLSEMFPEERESIRLFFEDARRAYEECYKDAEVYGVPLPAELIVKAFGEKALLNYPREHPHFYDWMNKTYKEKLDEYFKDEDLKRLLGALLGYIGVEAERSSAGSALTAVVAYYMYGGYFPKGGAQRFANALKKFIEDHGGEVLVRHRVDRILVESGEVKGVKVGDQIFKAPVVVANVNAKTALLELVGEKHLDAKFIEYIKSLKMSPSCFAVYLGVDMDLTGYPTIIVNLDDGYHVAINSNADPSLAPSGKASITILTAANYHEFPERGTPEYLRVKRELAEKLIQKAEKVIPNLRERIVVQMRRRQRPLRGTLSCQKGPSTPLTSPLRLRGLTSRRQ